MERPEHGALRQIESQTCNPSIRWRGAVFENWVVAEIVKFAQHRGRQPRVSFYRDQRGLEVDVIVERGNESRAVEVKSSATPSAHFFDALRAFRQLHEESSSQGELESMVIYGGSPTQQRRDGALLSWQQIDDVEW